MLRRQHSSHRTQVQPEVHGGDCPVPQEVGGSVLVRINAATIFPYSAYLHPPSSALLSLCTDPVKPAYASSHPEHSEVTEEGSSDEDSDMLDQDWHITLPKLPTRRIKVNEDMLSEASSSQHLPRARLLNASQLSPHNWTPSSQSTDARARLEILDSQPGSRHPPTLSASQLKPRPPSQHPSVLSTSHVKSFSSKLPSPRKSDQPPLQPEPGNKPLAASSLQKDYLTHAITHLSSPTKASHPVPRQNSHAPPSVPRTE